MLLCIERSRRRVDSHRTSCANRNIICTEDRHPAGGGGEVCNRPGKCSFVREGRWPESSSSDRITPSKDWIIRASRVLCEPSDALASPAEGLSLRTTGIVSSENSGNAQTRLFVLPVFVQSALALCSKTLTSKLTSVCLPILQHWVRAEARQLAEY
jgi:hypothetical protein